MNHTSEMRSSHEDRPSAAFHPAGSSATSARETVLKLEGAPASSEGSTSSTPSSPVPHIPSDPGEASLWRRLFPVDTDPTGTIDAEAASGSELGHFSIEERIGSGGMGAVFRTLDTRLQRVVALKVLSPVQSRDRAAVMRFQNEARAAARLDHENIARVFYIGEDHGLHFIAFEYVTGQNVREIIARSGRLRVMDAVNYVLQIASALRHTAAAGVVHRDIKPSNIIIAPNGRAKLVDLGLARKLASDSLGDLTVAGTTLGTFDYISPEQARDPRNVDIRSDIYSLGCTLYHMLTGGPPYSSGTVLQKLLDHQSGLAPDPHTINSSVPPALSAICRKMMAGDPKNRYATPDELIRDLAVLASSIGLRPTVADTHIWARPPASPVSRIRPGLIWAASATIVLLLAAFVDRWPADERPDPPDRHGTPDSATNTNSTVLPPENQVIASETKTGSKIATSAPTAPDASEDEASNPVGSDPLPTTNLADTPTTNEEADQTVQPPDMEDEPVPSDVLADSGTASPANPTPPVGDLPQFRSRDPEAPPSSEEAFNQVVSTAGAIANVFSSLSPIVDSLTPSAAPAVNPQTATESTLAASGEGLETSIPIVAPFAIQASDGRMSELREFSTLDEAISSANSGDVIELRFNGTLPSGPISEPIRIDDRQIFLEAGRDANNRFYEPVVEFVNDPAGMLPARMIILEGDSAHLELKNIQIRMAVDDASPLSDSGALFVLEGAASVKLFDVAIAVDSPRWSCSVFDLQPPSDPAAQSKSLMNTGGLREIFNIDLEHCFVRGSADLITFGHTQPGKVEIVRSGIVLQQSLLNVTGGINPSATKDDVDVTLNHVTAVLGNPLLRVDLSGLSRYVAPIHITASNNVIATSEKGQLIFMNGVSDGTSFADALVWTGERNIFDGFSEFWSVRQSAEGSSAEYPSTFLAWQQYWERRNSGTEREAEHAISTSDESIQLWDDPDAKLTEPLQFTADHLRLNPYAAAVELEATDYGAVGVFPDELPAIVSSTDEAVARDPESSSH